MQDHPRPLRDHAPRRRPRGHEVAAQARDRRVQQVVGGHLDQRRALHVAATDQVERHVDAAGPRDDIVDVRRPRPRPARQRRPRARRRPPPRCPWRPPPVARGYGRPGTPAPRPARTCGPRRRRCPRPRRRRSRSYLPTACSCPFPSSGRRQYTVQRRPDAELIGPPMLPLPASDQHGRPSSGSPVRHLDRIDSGSCLTSRPTDATVCSCTTTPTTLWRWPGRPPTRSDPTVHSIPRPGQRPARVCAPPGRGLTVRSGCRHPRRSERPSTLPFRSTETGPSSLTTIRVASGSSKL